MRQVENTCTRADAARERELYRYFEPPEVDKDAKSRITQQEGPSDGKDPYADPYAAKPPSSLENSLTALAELCALRLDVSRAVVRLVVPTSITEALLIASEALLQKTHSTSSPKPVSPQTSILPKPAKNQTHRYGWETGQSTSQGDSVKYGYLPNRMLATRTFCCH